MLEPTKKHHIKGNVQITFTGPVKDRDKAIALLKGINFTEVGDSVPWREVFTEYNEKDDPKVCLAGARYKENLTQKQLSEVTGIPQRHISEMENGKRPIGKKTAKKLAEALNISYKIFL